MKEMAIDITSVNNVISLRVIVGGKAEQTFKKKIQGDVTKFELRSVADGVKRFINRNLRLGLEYTGAKAKPLAEATIKAKIKKRRATPTRVFYDKGMLVNGLRIKPTISGYKVAFKPYVYPETNTSMNDVAYYLHVGGDDLPARPFFGLTKTQFNELVDPVNLAATLRRAKAALVRRQKAIGKRGLIFTTRLRDRVKTVNEETE